VPLQLYTCDDVHTERFQWDYPMTKYADRKASAYGAPMKFSVGTRTVSDVDASDFPSQATESKSSPAKITCSIGIMAYNEESNIGHLLQALGEQFGSISQIEEIIVVASGCTDRTEEIVKTYAAQDKRVRLIVQKEREGKASAINLFLEVAVGDVIILESGDTIPESHTVENLVRPFRNPRIGMAGARPVPVNPTDNFIGFTVNLYWRMHHEVALADPKSGEMIAFRNVFQRLPRNTAVDEASFEAMIKYTGFSITYAGDAVVRNKGAETVRDFLRQRRRVSAGHRHLRATQHYKVSTAKYSNMLRVARRLVLESYKNPKRIPWIFSAVALEIYGRFLGAYDYYIRKTNPFVWEIAESTKRLKDDPAGR
jgi:biofilm PGA synthesis N-glycosyltransferase PgaC